jgi:hypothetical protein
VRRAAKRKTLYVIIQEICRIRVPRVIQRKSSLAFSMPVTALVSWAAFCAVTKLSHVERISSASPAQAEPRLALSLGANLSGAVSCCFTDGLLAPGALMGHPGVPAMRLTLTIISGLGGPPTNKPRA